MSCTCFLCIFDMLSSLPPYYVSLFIKLFIYLFILFMAVLDPRFCVRAFSSCGERGPLFIAVRGPLTIAASLVVEHRLQMHRLQMRRLSSCGSQAQPLRGMWDLPRPALEPVSPAPAGRLIASLLCLLLYNLSLSIPNSTSLFFCVISFTFCSYSQHIGFFRGQFLLEASGKGAQC